MKIIISPAKKMKTDDGLPVSSMPALIDRTEILLEKMQSMDYKSLKNLWNCNDKIASENEERIRTMNLYDNLTPAILSYVGLQYQYMAPDVFTNSEFSYLQEHLRILSGFYGILRPFDGVVPYRLEMQARLSVGNCADLYEFWNRTPADLLQKDTDWILNLASNEYSKGILPYLKSEISCITCVFGEWNGRKVIEKGTICKMARGELVRFMAENQIESPEELQQFHRLNFTFDPLLSNKTTYFFTKGT